MIRIPLTSLHAPWVLLFGAGMAVVLIAAAAGAMAAGRLAEQPPAWLLAAFVVPVALARAAQRLAQNVLARERGRPQ